LVAAVQSCFNAIAQGRLTRAGLRGFNRRLSIGIGKRTGGIGKRTGGIGKRTGGIGKRTGGIGKRTGLTVRSRSTAPARHFRPADTPQWQARQ
jgi:hypothetical protein